MVVSGVVGGAALAALLSHELLKVLTGIFDPPPEHAGIPWSFVASTVGAVVVAALLTTGWLARSTSRIDPSRLRD
jgi:putative ABC transport system permease protein